MILAESFIANATRKGTEVHSLIHPSRAANSGRTMKDFLIANLNKVRARRELLGCSNNAFEDKVTLLGQNSELEMNRFFSLSS